MGKSSKYFAIKEMVLNHEESDLGIYTGNDTILEQDSKDVLVSEFYGDVGNDTLMGGSEDDDVRGFSSREFAYSSYGVSNRGKGEPNDGVFAETITATDPEDVFAETITATDPEDVFAETITATDPEDVFAETITANNTKDELVLILGSDLTDEDDEETDPGAFRYAPGEHNNTVTGEEVFDDLGLTPPVDFIFTIDFV